MELDNRQKKVVESEASHILCLASGGAGKTRTLTERIKHLIKDKKVKPEGIVAICFTNLAAEEMKKRLAEDGYGVWIGTIHSYANYICLKNGLDTQKFVDNYDFDKIIERAMTLRRSSFDKIEYLLVDECQDLSELEVKFLRYLPAARDFYVGDDRQCQPAGTKVMLRNNVIKNIEDIQVGDSIVYYNTQKAYMSGNKINGQSVEKKVLEISSREFVNDNLITITTESGLTSTYTPNHKAMVKLKGCEKNHAVYLMCDENYRFRVGKIIFADPKHGGYHQNPWREKMYREGCSKIWILGLYTTDKEARVMETKISYQYQIPQTCWQLDKVKWTAEDINFIYQDLNTYASAKKCLADFGRDINYPLLDKNLEDSSGIHFARNALTTCYAANIIPEAMEVLVYDETNKRRKRYETITKVSYQYISEPIQVYSLRVEDETYIADGILTHNSIYGFKGCSDEYLREMVDNPEYTKYYLTTNYRCAPNIIKKANSYLYSYDALSPTPQAKKTKDGIVEECSFYEALEDLEDSGNWGAWFIIARTNLEVDKIMEILDSKEIPNVTFKKGDLDSIELEELLAENRVKVLTIHSAKGLEAPKVILCGARIYNEEERKIAYVGATRAEQALYICPAVVHRGKGKRPLTSKTEAGNIFGKTSQKMIKF